MPDKRAPGQSAHVAAGRELSASGGPRLRRRIVGALVSFVAGLAALYLADLLLPGLHVNRLWSAALAVLLVAAVGTLVRPLLRGFALLLGWAGVFLLAVFGEAVVVALALWLTPGVEINGFGTAFLASWIVALVLTLAQWAQGVNEDEEFVGRIVRFGRRRFRDVATTDRPGVVFVQLDGVSEPLLRFALLAGNLPTLGRWIRDGSHVVDGWHVTVPTTTPVSQAGILLGHNHDIPAFRWWDRGLGRMLVANSPPDAAVIEERLSDGRGLLADDGASVGNIFTGDAPFSMMTMAGVGTERVKGLGSSRDWVGFFLQPYGLSRMIYLSLGEMLKERYQASREIRENRLPRTHRPWSYVVLRAATNVVMRQTNTVLVAEQMLRGRSSIYVDYLDYDEVAHHAGVARPESLATIQGIDRVLGQLEAIARFAPRPYHIVVLSDHGQSQGTTFADAYEPLETLAHRLMGGGTEAIRVARDDEDFGPLNMLLTEAARGGGTAARVTKSALGNRMSGDASAVGPSATKVAADQEAVTPELAVVGSGNLGGIWFPRSDTRMTLEDIQQTWPALVPGLVEHAGVGFVVALSREHGPVVMGRGGVRHLDTGSVDGVDPLAGFGELAASDFQRVMTFANAPDLYLNSTYDPVSEEVHAFEGLVGCHGGVGGWQEQAVLVHPRELAVDERVVGAEMLHRQLVRWLDQLGHRRDL
ncbi:MAG: alkaline phosphatase family protein [Actinomycetota bacterium]|nr:alkaline phosphatase family protein [Actinomycetota bacterium]